MQTTAGFFGCLTTKVAKNVAKNLLCQTSYETIEINKKDRRKEDCGLSALPNETANVEMMMYTTIL